MKARFIYKSSSTGKIVSRKYAEEHPSETYRHTLVKKSVGSYLIERERERQIEKLGYTSEQSVIMSAWYDQDQLQQAAHQLLSPELVPETTPILPLNWDMVRFEKMRRKPHLQRLVIAGALIAAQIDRLIEIDNL